VQEAFLDTAGCFSFYRQRHQSGFVPGARQSLWVLNDRYRLLMGRHERVLCLSSSSIRLFVSGNSVDEVVDIGGALFLRRGAMAMGMLEHDPHLGRRRKFLPTVVTGLVVSRPYQEIGLVCTLSLYNCTQVSLRQIRLVEILVSRLAKWRGQGQGWPGQGGARPRAVARRIDTVIPPPTLLLTVCVVRRPVCVPISIWSTVNVQSRRDAAAAVGGLRGKPLKGAI
jgi:hypothetical protein